MKTARSLIGTAVALLVVVFGYNQFTTSSLTRKVNELQEERVKLIEYARRLSADRRLAQVNVVEQALDERGQLVTTLLWQEINDNGVLSLPKIIEVVGTLVYFEAYVIKFEHELVGAGDPDRGLSVAMFRRIFGDRQIPDDVPLFDRAAPPLKVQDAAPGGDTVVLREEALWARFWDLAEQPRLAAQYGVRVAQCEAPAVRLRQGQVWSVSLDADGGMNLNRLELQ